MNELIDAVENLKCTLDNNESIKEIKVLNEEINNNKELLDLINEYRITGNEEIRNKIISNPLYSKYKHLENDINFIILDIRAKLKSINSKKGCSIHENN